MSDDDRSVEDEEEDSGGDTIRWMWCRRKAVCHMFMYALDAAGWDIVPLATAAAAAAAATAEAVLAD